MSASSDAERENGEGSSNGGLANDLHQIHFLSHNALRPERRIAYLFYNCYSSSNPVRVPLSSRSLSGRRRKLKTPLLWTVSFKDICHLLERKL